MIKDIVVSLGLGAKDHAGDFAISIADAFKAHVTGPAFSYEPIIPGAVMGGIPPEFVESQRVEGDKRARAAIARFEAAANRAGISAETLLQSASVSGAADRLAHIARRFDLVVVGQSNRDDGLPDDVLDEAALFESGRPVVFVPFIQKVGLRLDRVMVCWDGSRAATRAVADSMPFLKMATLVEVVIVTSKPGKDTNLGDEIAGADLGQHLARHGLKVEVKKIVSNEIDVPSTILSYAADSSADMIVMGGYGHSRLREFILGGVTRSILENHDRPGPDVALTASRSRASVSQNAETVGNAGTPHP